jgi:hypothetical protein
MKVLARTQACQATGCRKRCRFILHPFSLTPLESVWYLGIAGEPGTGACRFSKGRTRVDAGSRSGMPPKQRS